MSNSPIEAVLTRLRSDSALTAKVYDTIADNGKSTPVPPPYVVVFSNSGNVSGARLSGSDLDETVTFTIHAVGVNPEQSRAVAKKIRSLLRSFKPSITGKKCWPMKLVVSQPIRLDADLLPAVYYSVEEFQLSTTPA